MKVTRKYYIRFENIEQNLAGAIQITAKQYWNEMKRWDDIIEQTKDDENAGQAFKYTYPPVEKDMSIQYVDYLCYGCATVYLYREECKPGYAFKHRR